MHAGRLVRSVLTPLALALPPLFWVVDGTRRASSRRSGATRGSSSTSPGRSTAAPSTTATSATSTARSRTRSPRLPRARRRRRAPLPRPRPRRHRRDVRVRRRVPAGASRARAPAPCSSAPRGRSRLGRPQRRSTSSTASGTRAARELLRLVHARRASRSSSSRSAAAARGARIARLLVVVGALSVMPWFGKPTYALFTLAQLVALVVDGALAVARVRALGAFALAAVAGAARAAGVLLGERGRRLRVRAHPVRRRPGDVPLHLAARRRGHPLDPWFATHAIFALVGARRPRCPRRRSARCRRGVVAVALAPAVRAGRRRRAGQGLPVPLSPGHRGRAPPVARLRGVARRADARRAAAAGRSSPRAVAVASVLAVRVATRLLKTRRTSAHWLLWGGGDRRGPRERRVLRSTSCGPTSSPTRCARPRRTCATAPRRPTGADLRHGPVRPLPRRAPERDAVHLRLRPQRRRGARRRHRRRVRTKLSRSASAPSATRTRPTCSPASRPGRRRRSSSSISRRSSRTRRLGRLRRALREGGRVGARALPRDGRVWARSRMADETTCSPVSRPALRHRRP